MSIQELPEEIASYTRMLAETASDKLPSQHLGGLCLKLSHQYRALGISLLLREANIDMFFHWLIQSALARQYFLERCQSEGNFASPHRRASAVGPFFDAVTAAQWKLARKIATLAADIHLQGEEYEDDFAYARFLHLFTNFEALDTTGLNDALNQFEKALEGGMSVRLDLCRALLDKDQDAFDASFDGLLVDHELQMKKQQKSILARDATFEPNRQVMVEGLALLQIAGRIGLQTQSEYRFCPGLVRRVDHAPYKPLAFPLIPLEE
ncbi:Imm49 family immunity protein [Comamonas sp. JC664]|uniref:Imm49 family immunity protein n=1 Tax=Comamonas sp. JC664 TaxID=2801917 RepID=UPI00174DB0B9|nr:Imm49 family immunity protein [Comamonas sp. JC664]MBL0696458.1 immunity 49 family protein [Comamonas sp. JC664]GHG84331.1 hypothetical protein GCM10012319_39820 [Comamonas sp. KCTC 72670]